LFEFFAPLVCGFLPENIYFEIGRGMDGEEEYLFDQGNLLTQDTDTLHHQTITILQQPSAHSYTPDQ
jgi:hypothetical protein